MSKYSRQGYRNRNNEYIQVSEAHIDLALAIREQIRKASPRGYCNMSLHKTMMEESGDFLSDTCNNYRILLNDCARELTNEPPVEAPKTITNTDLASVNAHVGDLFTARRAVQNELRQLNKVKRDLADGLLFVEAIERAVKEIAVQTDLSVEPRPRYESEDGKVLYATLADLHFGAQVDIEGNFYDMEYAKTLLADYADKLICLAEKERIEKIVLVNTGDTVEHSSMRATNTFEAEVPLSEQVVQASMAIIQVLRLLATFIPEVEYVAINGNHDRLQGSKNETLYGDGVAGLSNAIIDSFTKYSGLPVTLIPTDPYFFIGEENGVNMLFVHGDNTPIARKAVLAEQSVLHDKQFQLLIAGHVHHFQVTEVGLDRYVITSGSFKGADTYTIQTLNTRSCRSQVGVLID